MDLAVRVRAAQGRIVFRNVRHIPKRPRTCQEPITDPDAALRRVSDLEASDNEWDETGPLVNKCLDALVAAGYVEELGHSPTGSLWRNTDAGHDRRAALGFD
jgi:hypothetical protein